MLSGGLLQAASFLEQSLARARDYEALDLHQFTKSIQNARFGLPTESSGPAQLAPSNNSQPLLVTLPSGFEWIRSMPSPVPMTCVQMKPSKRYRRRRSV